MTVFGDLAALVFVSLLWGGTNPIIRKGSKGVDSIGDSSGLTRVYAQMLYLLSRWQFVIPWLLNISGSLLFYFTLANADVSLAVPITTSFTLLFSIIIGHFMGEDVGSMYTYFSMFAIIAGVALCVYSRA